MAVGEGPPDGEGRGVAGERLDTYAAMRSFAATPEPRADAPPVGEHGAVALDGRRRFVVQHHRARRTHFDLRLEHRGVLVSWAVPKGPTLDRSVRRLAVRTEDHPFAYRWFEGVIASGYGAGDVIVWDDGWWEPGGGEDRRADDGAAPDAVAAIDAALDQGRLTLVLHGAKLRGGFALVRTGDPDDHRDGGDGPGAGGSWLLIKRADDDAVRGWRPEVPPRSVLTGRSNDEVVAGAPAHWEPPTRHELAALDALGDGGTWEVGGRAIAVTNLDKVILPAGDETPAVTKRDLVRHHATMAPHVAPYLWGRPVNLTRYPDGLGGESFWQKAVPAHAPEWLRRWSDPDARRGRTREYLVIDGAPALAWTANAAAVEIHPWTSTALAPDEPSYALVDIDPGPATAWDETVLLARQYRAALDHLGLVGRAKVTGKRGIQIWIPVRRGLGFADTRRFVERLSRVVGASVPDLVSWRWGTGEREGRARLDYTQNARNKTLVAPYAVRAAPGGPVSVPIEWDELDDSDLRPDRWTLHTVADRLAAVGDPFRALVGVDQDLPDL